MAFELIEDNPQQAYYVVDCRISGDAGALLNIACWKIDQIDHGKSIIYNVKGQLISKCLLVS